MDNKIKFLMTKYTGWDYDIVGFSSSEELLQSFKDEVYDSTDNWEIYEVKSKKLIRDFKLDE